MPEDNKVVFSQEGKTQGPVGESNGDARGNAVRKVFNAIVKPESPQGKALAATLFHWTAIIGFITAVNIGVVNVSSSYPRQFPVVVEVLMTTAVYAVMGGVVFVFCMEGVKVVLFGNRTEREIFVSHRRFALGGVFLICGLHGFLAFALLPSVQSTQYGAKLFFMSIAFWVILCYGMFAVMARAVYAFSMHFKRFSEAGVGPEFQDTKTVGQTAKEVEELADRIAQLEKLVQCQDELSSPDQQAGS